MTSMWKCDGCPFYELTMCAEGCYRREQRRVEEDCLIKQLSQKSEAIHD